MTCSFLWPDFAINKADIPQEEKKEDGFDWIALGGWLAIEEKGG